MLLQKNNTSIKGGVVFLFLQDKYQSTLVLSPASKLTCLGNIKKKIKGEKKHVNEAFGKKNKTNT